MKLLDNIVIIWGLLYICLKLYYMYIYTVFRSYGCLKYFFFNFEICNLCASVVRMSTHNTTEACKDSGRKFLSLFISALSEGQLSVPHYCPE
jgi:hypothetical protein